MQHKKFLVMVNYGAYEGWKLYSEVDTPEEAMAEYHKYATWGDEVMIVAYVPLVLGEIPSFGKQKD